MLSEAGVENTMFVSRPVAALIGAGYSPTMSVISVNIGALSTEVAVMHKGEVIISKRESIGGEDFDKVVKQYIFDQGDVSVSLSVAKAIKERKKIEIVENLSFREKTETGEVEPYKTEVITLIVEFDDCKLVVSVAEKRV
jgi:actin-like ATPase involved in cell morphogenesis